MEDILNSLTKLLTAAFLQNFRKFAKIKVFFIKIKVFIGFLDKLKALKDFMQNLGF